MDELVRIISIGTGTLLVGSWVLLEYATVRACITVHRLTSMHDRLRGSKGTPDSWRPFLRPPISSLPSLWLLIIRGVVFVPFGFIAMLFLVVVAGKASRVFPSVTALKIGRICGICLSWITGVRKVEFKGQPASTGEAPLVVANHLSWIDFIVLGSTTQYGFVMSEAVSTVPVIGKGFGELGKLVGCIALDRRSALSREETKLRIKERLHALRATGVGHRLVVFSEGTLTNGEGVVPLKTGAFEALVPTQPLRIELSNPHYSLASLDSLESVSFFLCLPGTDVTMTWCEVVKPALDDTAETFAERVRSEMVRGSNVKLAKAGSYRDHLEVCASRKCK